METSVLTIPFLSRELVLIGYSKLPFKYTQKSQKNCLRTQKKKELLDESYIDRKEEEEFSDSDEDKEKDMIVKFNKNEMLQQLIKICFKLVNHIKSFQTINEEQNCDHLIFDNRKLKKQLESCQLIIEAKEKKIAADYQVYNQLLHKYENLQKKFVSEGQNQEKEKHATDMRQRQIKVELSKKCKEVQHLNDVLWRKFQVQHIVCIEDNFQSLKIHKSNLKRLWNDVKFAKSTQSREEILKNAVCQFEENTNLLMEENLELRCILCNLLTELSDGLSVVLEKLNIHSFLNCIYNLKKIFLMQVLDIDQVRNMCDTVLKYFKKIFLVYSEKSFNIGEDIFLCWSDIIKYGARDIEKGKLC